MNVLQFHACSVSTAVSLTDALYLLFPSANAVFSQQHMLNKCLLQGS